MYDLSILIPARNEPRKEYRRQWSLKNKGKLREQDRVYKAAHRERVNEVARLGYRRNRVKELDRIRLKKYGIGGDEFRERMAAQNNLCLICKTDIGDRNLSVDHDHATGTIRGLICSNCNFSIGHAKDSPELLRAMADYLEKAK